VCPATHQELTCIGYYYGYYNHSPCYLNPRDNRWPTLTERYEAREWLCSESEWMEWYDYLQLVDVKDCSNSA
jgi:hypothetical protein